MLLADHFVLLQRTVQQGEQIVLAQGLEHIYLTAAQQRCDNLKTRVLGSSTDQGDKSFFHSTEQTVLLRLAEAVDLVDEQDR